MPSITPMDYYYYSFEERRPIASPLHIHLDQTNEKAPRAPPTRRFLPALSFPPAFTHMPTLPPPPPLLTHASFRPQPPVATGTAARRRRPEPLLSSCLRLPPPPDPGPGPAPVGRRVGAWAGPGTRLRSKRQRRWSYWKPAQSTGGLVGGGAASAWVGADGAAAAAEPTDCCVFIGCV